ncbi:nicotinamide riboside transporter PnuC [Streptococcus didelphis]|uniref:nicotinamide riboside transporter PnuC n=1 Tax=Streptococcus didelphis TaxID=102886 RepID=UPI00036C31D7|nr:nicotinamide riboside transporter PnuC [Streptococcus didelphis]WMB30049.1 nicotinamide riboside transporter PnuC [Streptococcus didelphis]
MTILRYFSKIEWLLWIGSLLTILITNLAFANSNLLALTASLIGATSLIFSAKGNPIGPGLTILFSVIYAYLSLTNHYYGEVITYFCMTLPMALLSLFSWLNHPFQGQKSEVIINHLNIKDIFLITLSTFLVTLIFYFILSSLHTAFLMVSTLSVSTSFMATFLSYKRSPYFAVAFTLNDIILIILWLSESQKDPSHYSIVTCFIIFLINDIYTFFNWLHIQNKQEQALKKDKI